MAVEDQYYMYVDSEMLEEDYDKLDKIVEMLDRKKDEQGQDNGIFNFNNDFYDDFLDLWDLMGELRFKVVRIF